ncbi:MAG: PilZ domain-containing protein [Planctomycetota bacterium]
MSARDANEMTDQLETRRAEFTHARTHARYKLPHETKVVVDFPSKRDDTRFEAMAYDISNGGIGVFHGRFEYPGARCVVEISGGPQGDVIVLDGEVVRCELMKGRVHEIGIKFKEEFDASAYFEKEKPEPGDPDPSAKGFNELPQIDQAALLVITALTADQPLQPISPKALAMLLNAVDNYHVKQAKKIA